MQERSGKEQGAKIGDVPLDRRSYERSLGGLFFGLRAMLAGNFKAHRWSMWTVYISACLIAGAFTLLPGRYLGRLVWGTWLGWL